MKLLSIILALLFFITTISAQEYPKQIQNLISAYPNFHIQYDGKYIILKEGQKIIYDDRIKKSGELLLNKPSISDMFQSEYPKNVNNYIPSKDSDPGRIRNEDFMKAMYGSNSPEVQKNLVTIVWCPKLVGSKIRITKINNVHLQLQKISEELDKHPELQKYLQGATTFNWRIIKGTNRLSTHSFGTSIDLNVKFSNYWQWDCKCTNEEVDLKYKNQIPKLIVEIFEKHGFIWGGKWYHYDTMHFEYRPDLLN
ncbi:M15 family metallopeptidase [Dysgonomonas sp. HGC4]|uniref:M15 family metallopeptidase n=1 Tax=Dysgonomonas sp. HGC4 TaxID=1658009 RepID=UPI0006814FC2|nr:M15 family metallopeptidase [Dysgonomonas sp. HGC4]MBD8347782.1 M15 family metallopeptidase [Dysgonomonas sp. HGC4]